MRQRDGRTRQRRFPADDWATSTFCGPNGGNCVEVNLGASGLVGLRDGKFRHGRVLVFGDPQWQIFLSGARDGRFDH